ncbi:MAG: hypothetical protein AB1556_11995 [Bacillota bacterium]
MGQKRAVLLLAAANESIGVPEGLTAARLRLTQCLEEIFFWQKQLAETEAAMEKALVKTGLATYLTW